MSKKKKIKLPDSQVAYYPFGGMINSAVTNIAKKLGANDENAQLWGSAISTLTGVIPGMQDNLTQGFDLAGDVMNKIKMEDGGTLPTKKKVKYTRLADKTTGEIEVSAEDLKWIDKYNEAVSLMQKNPDLMKTTQSKDYKAIGNIKQTAGVASGQAKADYVVTKPITELKDEDLEKMSPYLYSAGYTTVKDQKELLDNIYRITGTDIISNDYRPGMRHQVTFEYDKEEPQKVTPKVITPDGQQNIYSQDLKKTYDIKKSWGKDKYGRPILISQTPTTVTENAKTIGQRNDNQALSPEWSGEFTSTQQGITNTENIEDPTLNVAKKKALGGELPPLKLMDNPDEFTSPAARPVDPANYAWDLRGYKEQQMMQMLPDGSMVPTERSSRIKAHYKNIVNLLSPNKRAVVGNTQFALGGDLTEYQGNTHEEGGVPITPEIEVEGGETRHQDYIYSDRIKLPWNKKRTFAEESKRINNKYKDREDDAIAQKSRTLELSKLKDAQELMKQQMVQKANKMIGDAGVKMALGGGTPVYSGDPYASMDISTRNNSFPTIDPNSQSYNSILPDEYKDYTPEEQQMLAQFQNQYATEMQDPSLAATAKQRYDENIAQLGNRNFNQSHINPNYTFPNGENGTAPDLSGVGNNMGSRMQSSSNNSNSQFNDGLTTAQKFVPYAGAIGQAATLLGGIEKTKYDRVTPELVDLEAQRKEARRQKAIAQLSTNYNIRNTAGNTGRAMSNMVASNAALYDSLGSQLSQSYMNEENANSQIKNQAGMFNAQVQAKEEDANAMNRARFRDTAVASLQNIANTYMGVTKDQNMYKSQNLFNNVAAQTAGTQDFNIIMDPETGTLKYVKA